MAHRHSQHEGCFLMLDALAAHSGLLGVSPGLKMVFCVGTLLLCVGAADAVVGATVALSMMLLIWKLGGVPLGGVLQLLRLPLVFLIVSCLVVLLNVTPEPTGVWRLSLGSTWLCVTQESLHRTITLFFQAMGAVCCLYFLSTSTPIPQIIEVLRRCHVSELMIELMYLIYRYLFVLLQMQRQMTLASTARLGYAGFGRSISTAGRICGCLLAASFRRSSLCYDAMEARGYDGTLRFLTRTPPLRKKHVLWAAAYGLTLLVLIMVRKRWFKL